VAPDVSDDGGPTTMAGIPAKKVGDACRASFLFTLTVEIVFVADLSPREGRDRGVARANRAKLTVMSGVAVTLPEGRSENDL